MKVKLLQVRESSEELIDSPMAVARMMAQEAKADRECFWILHLNGAHRVIEKELVSLGTVNNALVHPREVFKKAILNGSQAIMTVHNHPGGSIEPSSDDQTIWERLDKAGELLGIGVLDHIILTSSGRHYAKSSGRFQS